MTLAEFLEKVKEGPNKSQALDFMVNLISLLKEFDTESCRTLAGIIRSQMIDTSEAAKKPIPVTDLIDLCSLSDKLDATLNEVYVIQFTERLDEIARETGQSYAEIKTRTVEYRKSR